MSLEIVYLYIEAFQWVDPSASDRTEGHPHTKKVYRTAYDPTTGNYRIIYNQVGKEISAVVINKLINEDIELGFTCKLVELDKASILKYDLPETELDKLVGWIESDNEDIKFALEDKQPDKMNDLMRLDTSALEFFKCALELRDLNPLMFDSLHDFIHHAIDEKPNDSSVDATWISLSKRHGTGVNISAALNHISIYAGDNKRTNLDERDLHEAIKYLLNENSQRNFNG